MLNGNVRLSCHDWDIKDKAINQLIQAVIEAHNAGLTREQVRALCGAAFCDWYETTYATDRWNC